MSKTLYLLTCVIKSLLKKSSLIKNNFTDFFLLYQFFERIADMFENSSALIRTFKIDLGEALSKRTIVFNIVRISRPLRIGKSKQVRKKPSIFCYFGSV